MPKTALKYTVITAAIWSTIFAVLFACERISIARFFPGRVLFSFSYWLVVASVLTSASHCARMAPTLRSGLVAGTLCAIFIATLVQGLVPGPLLAWIAGASLLVGGLWLAVALGREVISPTYIWPLVIVAVCMDAWSVFSPVGITNQLLSASTDAGFNPMILVVPIPGIGLEPILGMGDVIFVGFLGGAVERLKLSQTRFIWGAAAGFGLCLIALLIWAVPLPALTFVGPATAAALGLQARSTRRELCMALVFVLCFLALVRLATLI